MPTTPRAPNSVLSANDRTDRESAPVTRRGNPGFPKDPTTRPRMRRLPSSMESYSAARTARRRSLSLASAFSWPSSRIENAANLSGKIRPPVGEDDLLVDLGHLREEVRRVRSRGPARDADLLLVELLEEPGGQVLHDRPELLGHHV